LDINIKNNGSVIDIYIILPVGCFDKIENGENLINNYLYG